jgi:hypothetical protein
MLRAVETAYAAYADRSRDISRLAAKMSRPDQDPISSTVGLMANQHAAEADLMVAKVADETTQSLIHVVA